MRSHRWTINRIVLGVIGGLFVADFMDVGSAKTSMGLCLELGMFAMIGLLIAVYSNVDILRAASWREKPPCPRPDTLWDREQDG
jgi:hypothetical protein